MSVSSPAKAPLKSPAGARPSQKLHEDGGANEFVHRSALEVITSSEPPASITRTMPSNILIVVILLGVLASVVGIVRRTVFVQLIPAGLLVAGLGFILLLSLSRHFNQVLVRYAQQVDAAIEELEQMRNLLTAFIEELDERTRKYFHCVTNTKVTNYFILRQIETGLVERLQKLEKFTNALTAARVVNAHQLLRQPFEYRDGFAINSGELYRVQLGELERIVARLEQELNEGVAALEDEINRAKSDMDLDGQ